jgi:glycosyltransferase involved in cell wall biosynthesis
MARPVITTDNVGCRDTIIDGLNGFMVPPRDVDALVAAMLRFVGEPALVETMGRASRRLAEERFDVHRINAKLIAEMGLGHCSEATR